MFPASVDRAITTSSLNGEGNPCGRKLCGPSAGTARDRNARHPELGLDVARPFLGLVLIIVLFGTITRDSGTFLTADNWRTIAVQTVIVGTAALGMTIIMIAGGIDLSAGSTVALVTVCIAMFVKKVDPALVGFAPGLEARPAVSPVAGNRDRRIVRSDQRRIDRGPAGRPVHRHAG